jgi:hypothetical protein
MADELADLDALGLELVQLRHRLADLQRQHERALERIALYPNEAERARAAKLAASIDEMIDRSEQLEAQLLPVRRHDE